MLTWHCNGMILSQVRDLLPLATFCCKIPAAGLRYLHVFLQFLLPTDSKGTGQ